MNFFRAFLVVLFFILLTPSEGYAQQSAGVSINRATIEAAADPGDVLNEEMEVTNLSDQEQTYYIFARDIVGVRDGNAPEFAREGQELTGFELSTWLDLPSESITIPAGGKQSLQFTIKVPNNATPGSHFGGVFVSVEPPKFREIGASVGYDVASIVSIKISGDATISAQIREFSTEKIIHGSTAVDFNVRIQNTGTVLVRPYGPLEVYNMFGRRVHTDTFNETAGGVFPGTIRDFTESWSDENPGFGRYQAVLALVYEAEGGNRTIDAAVSFWILPMNIIGPALIILIVLLLISYFAVRLYVRRAVQQVSGTRRPLVRRQRKSKQISMLMLVSIVLLTVTALFLILLLILFA